MGAVIASLLVIILKKNTNKGSFILTVGPLRSRFYNLTKETKMALILTADQKVKLTITPVDSYGNLSVVENVTWSVSNPNVLAIESVTDTEVFATTLGPMGDAQIVVTADARIGEGTVELTGVIDVSVLAAEATALAVVAGVPEPK